MKKLLLLVISLMVLALSGCSHETDLVASKVFEIAMADDDVLQLQIPVNWELKEQDGCYYWLFKDKDKEYTVYKMASQIVIGDQVDNCLYSNNSVSRNFTDYSITIKAKGKDLDTVGALLNVSNVIDRTVLQYKERGMSKLPVYQDYPMDLTTNKLYMPLQYNEVDNDVYTACHSINGNSFVTCWIMNYRLEDLKPILHNLVTVNTSTSKLNEWYESDEIYYAEADNLVVACKKLTYNKWCCYLATNDSYKDYVIKAMYKVTKE